VDPKELMRYLAETFDRLGIRYFVTGSTATITYGEPRFTNDIDVVVELRAADIEALLCAFPPSEYYVSRIAVEDAVAQRHQFNIIHPASGLKADVIIASNSEYDELRLSRARRLPVLPERSVSFASPEDVILKKMEYYREGASAKHLRDIAGVLRVQQERLDRQYVSDWAKRLNLEAIWNMVQSAAVERSSDQRPEQE
jgi:hypothetical protein